MLNWKEYHLACVPTWPCILALCLVLAVARSGFWKHMTLQVLHSKFSAEHGQNNAMCKSHVLEMTKPLQDGWGFLVDLISTGFTTIAQGQLVGLTNSNQFATAKVYHFVLESQFHSRCWHSSSRHFRVFIWSRFVLVVEGSICRGSAPRRTS